MAETISVRNSMEATYQIMAGRDLNEQIISSFRASGSEKAFAVVDENVFHSHFSFIEEILKAVFENIHYYKVPAGEKSKSFQNYQQLLHFILENYPERSTPVIAIGGGVTGDLAGFAASTALRGLPLFHLPTSLLAMVDSSIGGKTGINTQIGKNLIGTFYQPKAVFADVRFLETLPEKEWVNGLSEILKYAMINDPDIIHSVNSLLNSTSFKQPENWLDVIRKSAEIKARIVQDDVLEAGKRKLLNFGHTFAHVLEAEGGFSAYSHGEAVYAGMLAAVFASNKLGAKIDENILLQFRHLYDFNLSGIKSSSSSLAEFMKRDKKTDKQQLQLILLKKAGKAYVHTVEKQEMEIVKEAWNYILMEFEA